MRIAVISCEAYRDAIKPFFALMDRFWSDRPYPLTLYTDAPGESWCSVVARCAQKSDDAVMILQEDFFLSAPVNQPLIDHALEQMKARNAGMVRLYPCPGADEDYGDPYFGIVKRGSRYRISCQASIWRSDFLYAIASQFNTPQEFELMGSGLSDALPSEVLAFKRDVKPWPLEYLCTAIVNGKWSQGAKQLCDSLDIEVNWSMREFQSA